ncbi:MAG: Gfo/Idh/MocA family oxidoreductase [Burkholderiales bacterium]|nr:Gfo/Idh/MocA family oxidoreductase [Burkholderiales bacterium]
MKTKVSVIGAGWFAAQSHIPVLARRDDVALDGVCRLGAEELERVRSHFGFAFASEDYREVLARRPDAVIVSSPHHLHYEQACAALAAGAHVMIEKPMTLDPAESWDLVRRARAAGRQIVVANGYHYLGHIEPVRQALREGAVGPIEHVLCTFVSATRAVFEGGEGLKRWTTTFFRPDRSTWQDPAQGGGFAYGQLSHSIAMMLHLTGLEPVGVSGRVVSADGVDVCDAGVVRFAGGAVASLSGAAALPEGERGILRFIVTGRDGVLEVEFDRDRAVLRRRDGQNRTWEVPAGAWVYTCEGPPNALVDLCRGTGENLSPGETGAATVGVIAALLQSAGAGGVEVPVQGREVRP